ncbi:MAG: hypothetical protein ACTSRP_09445 [Candidatus Helarchaeota archaeon]
MSPWGLSPLFEEAKIGIKKDILMHFCELRYEFSNLESKSVLEYIKNKFEIILLMRQCQYLLHQLSFTSFTSEIYFS